ncbi:MAG: metallophosphoesterase [Proteobacteria bacterium]|nr:metallophosphoesterase [Pseudomonadota bacterium]
MMPVAPSARVLRLPRQGALLVGTDLHGNLGDFRRLQALFEVAQRRSAGAAQLLFTGDLIHGPNFSRRDWPEFMGSYYEDQSAQLLDALIALQRRYPGQVHSLLGNHEHSHIGGPHTPKFWSDETKHFEDTVGPLRAARYRALLEGFPLVAVTRCGVALTHAAPNVVIDGAATLEALSYAGHEQMRFDEVDAMPALGRLLWARRCPRPVGQAFLRALSDPDGPPLRLVVFGHEVVNRGFHPVSDEQLVLSTSFGLQDASKHYLELDLAGSYRTTADLRLGHELLPLYGATHSG